MIPFLGFVGGTYEHPSSNVNAERCINWIPEALPPQANGKARFIYVCRPGLSSFATSGSGRCRASFEQNGRAFMVSGDSSYEVYSDGTTLLRGTAGQLGDNGRPASIASNGPQGGQIAMASNGGGFIFNTTTNTLTAISDPQFPSKVVRVDFWRGHFVWTVENSTSFYLSNQYDGTAYDTADVGEKSLSSDYIVTHLVDDSGELWLFGLQKTEVWQYTGASGFPAQPVNAVIPIGAASPFSWTLVGGSPYGLAHNRTVVRFRSGYQFETISHHALEATLESYTDGQIANSVAFTLDWRGHRFFVLSIDDDATWVYDEATGFWHQWDYWVSAQAQSQAFLGMGYLKLAGKHLMGSRKDGAIYQFSDTAATDAGNNIRVVRRAPYVHANGMGVVHGAIGFDFQSGVGDATTTDPVALLRWSDTQAKTWSNERALKLGAQGRYGHDVSTDRLGLAALKGRVYELVITDPVVRQLTGAYLDLGVAA